MANETWLRKNLRNVAGQVPYETERLILGINEEIVKQMASQNMTRTELAARIGVDKAYITRMLNGAPNVTLKTLVSVATALRCRFDVPALNKIEKAQQFAGTVVKFDRPVTSIVDTRETFRPVGEQSAAEVVLRERSLEVDADASAAAA